MKALLSVSLILVLLVSACSPKPVEINYGQDICDHCSMMIMDAAFAAEVVTDKGKVYKYDSIECMVKGLKASGMSAELILVMDHNNPDHFLPARKAVYLMSDELKSPMGGNLAAFSSEEEVLKLQLSGSVFDWNQLWAHL